MNKSLIIATLMGMFMYSCSKTIDNTGTCSDGRQNQGEQGIDCGGPCDALCPSCADGIMNQDENAVDCGGLCDPCYPRLSASLNEAPWNSTSRNAFLSGPGTLRIYGTDQFKSVTLYYSGPFSSGSIPTGTNFTCEFRDENGNLFSSSNVGSITFSTFDTINKKVSGIYNVNVEDFGTGATISVSNGVFTELNY
jgi:hypothetical protein